MPSTGGVEGQSNLYHFEESQGGGFAYKLVATLSPALSGGYERDWSPTANELKTARVSKDGGTVLFMSGRPLAGAPAGSCIIPGTLYGGLSILDDRRVVGLSLVQSDR